MQAFIKQWNWAASLTLDTNINVLVVLFLFCCNLLFQLREDFFPFRCLGDWLKG